MGGWGDGRVGGGLATAGEVSPEVSTLKTPDSLVTVLRAVMWKGLSPCALLLRLELREGW
jgi:hypothetical protein